MKIIQLLLAYLVVYLAVGENTLQAQSLQVLPSPICFPTTDELLPSLDATGRVLVYETPKLDLGEHTVMVSYQKAGKWSMPEPIAGLNSGLSSLYTGGYTLSSDANIIFFSSARRGGVGGNDVWYMERQNNTWSSPVNLAKPINTTGSEMDPSLSSDGRTLLFTRTSTKLSAQGKPCGSIWISNRISKEQWSEPKLLPSPINSGCECNARFLSDGSTITFASQRAGGKGGLDQYLSRLNTNGVWSIPVLINLVNTPSDDLYIAIPAGGDYVYYTLQGTKSKDIVRAILPIELKPKKMVLMKGILRNASTHAPLSAIASVRSLTSNDKSTYSIPIATTGEFFFCFSEQTNSDLIFQYIKGGFFPKVIPIRLDTLNRFKELNTDIELVPISVGATYVFSNRLVQQNPMLDAAQYELGLLLKILKERPTMKIELGFKSKEAILSDSIMNDGLVAKQFFMQNGIAEQRIITKKYSDTQLCGNKNSLTGICIKEWLEMKVLEL